MQVPTVCGVRVTCVKWIRTTASLICPSFSNLSPSKATESTGFLTNLWVSSILNTLHYLCWALVRMCTDNIGVVTRMLAEPLLQTLLFAVIKPTNTSCLEFHYYFLFRKLGMGWMLILAFEASIEKALNTLHIVCNANWHPDLNTC